MVRLFSGLSSFPISLCLTLSHTQYTKLTVHFLIPYLPVYKSIPCISRPPFWSQKISFSYFCVRIFLKNFSFILEFPFRYAMSS